MKLLLSTFVASLLTLVASAKFHIRSLNHSLTQDDRSLKQDGRSLVNTINLGFCSDFALFAGSTATCAGALDCNINNGDLGISPGTSYTGNFFTGGSTSGSTGGSTGGSLLSTLDSITCTEDGLAAWTAGKHRVESC
jgi:hypothetical protein